MKHALPCLLLACAQPVFAQQEAAANSAEACVAIEIDADRLACYDAALHRTPRDTRQADIAAKEARAIRENLELGDRIEGNRDKTGASDLYAQDDPLASALANAGKGSML
ncbi:MAG TPA: phospholipase, partial [Luteimonas sp.]|nr:phospholipase [Luteimonas sp.]